MKTNNTDVPAWDRRRPRTLVSGLMTCDSFGGGYYEVSRDYFGCTSNRAKGDAICENTQTILQRELEDLLDAMQHTLMDEAAPKIFCEEYARERNQLCAVSTAGRDGLETEMLQVARDHGTLIDAILAGISAEQVKDRMNALDKRRTEIQSKLQTSPAPDLIRIQPKMAVTYRERIATLIKRLSDPDGMDEA